MSRQIALRMLILFGAAVLAGSLMPYPAKIALHTTDNVHYIHATLHVFVFALLGFLSAALARSRAQLVAAVLAAMTFGLTTEVLEAVVFSQKLEMSDVALDAAGSALGLGIQLLRLARTATSSSTS